VRGVETGLLIGSVSVITAASPELSRSFGEMLSLLGKTHGRTQSTEVPFAN